MSLQEINERFEAPFAEPGDLHETFGISTGLETSQSALKRSFDALHSTRIRFARNETIFNEGDCIRHAYIVACGTVRLCKHTLDGRRQIANFLVPGDLFSVLHTGEYGFSAEAVTDVVLIAYPSKNIERLCAEEPSAVKRSFAFLSDQLLTMQQHLVLLGCQSAKERVASFLVRFADRSVMAPGEWLDLPMGRQDIASHLGLSVETVCRSLSELKRDGAVAVPNLDQIILRNSSALRALADGNGRI